MITLSNGLSLVRAPLAFLFLQENATLRFLAIFLAMITDSIDGYLARRYRSASKFGAILDPAMDKFFVYFALTVLFSEGRLATWELLAMLSRDFFVSLYALLMLISGNWNRVELRPLRWGKVTTALQFIVLMGLTLQHDFSSIVFASFIAMGCFAFYELIQTTPKAEVS